MADVNGDAVQAKLDELRESDAVNASSAIVPQIPRSFGEHNEDLCPEFEQCTNKSKSMRNWLVTWSNTENADLLRPQDYEKKHFLDALKQVFGSPNLKYVFVFEECHENGTTHFHACISLRNVKCWWGPQQKLLINHKIATMWSDKHHTEFTTITEPLRFSENWILLPFPIILGTKDEDIFFFETGLQKRSISR